MPQCRYVADALLRDFPAMAAKLYPRTISLIVGKSRRTTCRFPSFSGSAAECA
jgi:hypothetical protein